LEWIAAIQKALNYIEEHLLEEIDYDEIASSVYISSFHFHSAFSLIMGMTANEYIRKRRLSMAGQELTLSKEKIIDIAFKYGYDSPESFAKAFSRFHGISPSQARHPGSTLTLFNPMKIKITVEGGSVMDYRIETREEFSLMVVSRAFLNEKINEEGNHDIPDFWDECAENGIFSKLKPYRLNDDNYAACSSVSSEKNCFDYGIGVLCDKNAPVPQCFKVWTIDKGMWAVFQCIGKDASSMDGVWENIYKEFLPQSGYEIRNYADFEYYPAHRENVFCEIWVPVRKK
jgi:AraC family transcriptional regulator